MLSAALTFANQWMSSPTASPLGDQLKASFEGQELRRRGPKAGYRFALPVNHASLGITPYAAAADATLAHPGLQ